MSLARRVFGLLLAVTVPTVFLSWLLSFNKIKKRINGRIWCSDVEQVVFDVNVTSRSGSTTYYSDRLLCRNDDLLVRTIGDLRMLATTIAVSFAISLLLLALLVASLWTYSKLRRRATWLLEGRFVAGRPRSDACSDHSCICSNERRSDRETCICENPTIAPIYRL